MNNLSREAVRDVIIGSIAHFAKKGCFTDSDTEKQIDKIMSLAVEQWISVDDWLPERCKPTKPVKIYVTYYGYCCEAFYSDEGEFCREWNGKSFTSVIRGVIAWMPLPQPPMNTEEEG